MSTVLGRLGFDLIVVPVGVAAGALSRTESPRYPCGLGFGKCEMVRIANGVPDRQECLSYKMVTQVMSWNETPS